MIILGVGVMFIAAVQHSLVNFSAVKIDTTDIFIFAGIILVAIGAIWGIRKMIVLGYLSSVPDHWQKKYDREQDLADYKEFRDDGGFERGTRLGFFGGKSWYYDKDAQVDLSDSDEAYEEWHANYEPSSHVDDEDNWYESSEDDLEDEYIEWRNEQNESIDACQYVGDDDKIHVGHPDDADEEEDLNIGWEK